MKRIDELQNIVDNWEYRKEITDEQVFADYVFLLTEIARLNRIIKNAKIALEE